MRKVRQYLFKYMTKMNPIVIYFFVLSLQLNNSKDFLILTWLDVEGVWCFRVLFADLLIYVLLFTLFENRLFHIHTVILYFRKWLGFTLNYIFLHFFFRISYSFRKGAWMCKIYPTATLAAIHRLFSSPRILKYSW